MMPEPVKFSGGDDSSASFFEQVSLLDDERNLGKSNKKQPVDTGKEIGQKLGFMRRNAGKSIEEIACLLKISPVKILAIEEGRFNELTDLVFVIGLIRGFAKQVGLDPTDLIVSIKTNQDFLNSSFENLTPDSGKGTRPSFFKTIGYSVGWIKSFFILFFGIFFLSFAFFSSKTAGQKMDFLNFFKKKENLLSPESSFSKDQVVEAPRKSRGKLSPLDRSFFSSEKEISLDSANMVTELDLSTSHMGPILETITRIK